MCNILNLVQMELATRQYKRADQWATRRRVEGAMYELEACEDELQREYIIGKLEGMRMFHNIRRQVRHDEFRRGYI